MLREAEGASMTDAQFNGYGWRLIAAIGRPLREALQEEGSSRRRRRTAVASARFRGSKPRWPPSCRRARPDRHQRRRGGRWPATAVRRALHRL